MDPRLFSHLAEEVRRRLCSAEPAHDFCHVLRVVENARLIADAEGANSDVVRLSALLHELVNLPKHHPQSVRSGELCALQAVSLLTHEGVEKSLVQQVGESIRVHGFSAGLTANSLEAQILQDADRLDAIGAIGVARCFATCSSMGRPFYNPEDPFCEHREPDDKQWGLDHFYRQTPRDTGATQHTHRVSDCRTAHRVFYIGF